LSKTIPRAYYLLLTLCFLEKKQTRGWVLLKGLTPSLRFFTQQCCRSSTNVALQRSLLLHQILI
jgi:hypothetical protein